MVKIKFNKAVNFVVDNIVHHFAQGVHEVEDWVAKHPHILNQCTFIDPAVEALAVTLRVKGQVTLAHDVLNLITPASPAAASSGAVRTSVSEPYKSSEGKGPKLTSVKAPVNDV